MYKLTSNETPFVHYQCGCSRVFIGDEMYVCNTCNKAMCRYCMQEEEVKEFYCRHCLDKVSTYDATNQNNFCMRHLQCPICFQVLNMSILMKKGKQNKESFYYNYCNFCKWDATEFGFQARDINNLLAKVSLYKGQYLKSPQTYHYQRIVEVIKFNISTFVKQQQEESRAKRMAQDILFHKKENQNKVKFTREDFVEK